MLKESVPYTWLALSPHANIQTPCRTTCIRSTGGDLNVTVYQSHQTSNVGPGKSLNQTRYTSVLRVECAPVLEQEYCSSLEGSSASYIYTGMYDFQACKCTDIFKRYIVET
jgi:hypothetical protein